VHHSSTGDKAPPVYTKQVFTQIPKLPPSSWDSKLPFFFFFFLSQNGNKLIEQVDQNSPFVSKN
jgi:hypothetical protein